MRVLRPITNKKKTDEIKNNFFVFDIETTDLEPMQKNFVFGVIYGHNFHKVIYSVEEFQEEFKKKKYSKKYLFAHNAEFDLLGIYGNIYQNLDNSAVFNGKFISAKINDSTFGDSLNIFPMSAEKIGKTIGLEKLDNEKVKGEKLRKNNITQFDIDYCIRDCEIIYTALLRMFEKVGTIKLTIASLSMFDFRNKFLGDNLLYSELNDEFFESYYGGRTEAFIMGQGDYDVYDINSLYPYVMANIVFPDVRNLKKETKIDVKYFKYCLIRYEGLARVKVRHKETYFGYLPYKGERLLFPVGEYWTTVNFNELRFAFEKGVIEFLEVDYIVYGNAIETPFREFILTHYKERLNAESELDKLIEKLKMNSLYGRFAMREKFTTTYYDMLPFELIEELQKCEKFYELKVFSAERNDCFLVTENDKMKNSFFAIPTFSSYITSQARITLLKSLIENEHNRVAYCDTDSVFLEKDFVGDIGINLGQFKKENKKVIEIRGLKNYTKVENGVIEEVIKGVSKRSVKVGENTYQIQTYLKTKEALRRNKEAGQANLKTKKLTFEYNKREVINGVETKPLKIFEK